MAEHPVVSNEAWLAARKVLLAKEKRYSQQRDELTAARLALPWRRVETDYVFESSAGPVAMADLFGACSQLFVYHFMFGPDWPEGCKICSMCADHYDPLVVHLRHRDVALVTISRAPIGTLEAYKQRMGWSFPWVSALDTTFNQDFGVSFEAEEIATGTANYNYTAGSGFGGPEAPGASMFVKTDAGEVFHTYSTYGRGLENLLGIYNLLDLVSKGRDEASLPFGMAWVRHRDKY